jgi:hypothetical protein
MHFSPNQRFYDFLAFLRQRIDTQPILPVLETVEYQSFIKKFPAQNLANLTLEEYCVGTGKNDSFCWWIERGLEKVLGRYSPGTSRGHVLYIDAKMRQVAKVRKLQNLSDEDALHYTLTIQAAIASASLSDVEWVDSDQEIYRRTGLPPRCTVAEGRKLRLLSCYHPDKLLPLSSSAHAGHFLTEFGCPSNLLSKIKQPVARLLLLSELYAEAKKHVPGLSTNAMMWAMYDKAFGLAPVKDGGDGNGAADAAEEIAEVDNFDEMPAELEESDAELNRILAGPPGTGKTYATIDEAISIIDPDFFAQNFGNRREMKARFDELVSEHQIRFTTFHQSFSYEDFVEGLRAETDDETGQVSYRIEPGVFQRICTDASKQAISLPGLGLNDNPRVWKISIAGSAETRTRRYCLDHGQARIGWGEVGDLRSADLTQAPYHLGSNDRSCLRNFSQDIQSGDILLCLASNTHICAVGVVQGEYYYDPNPPAELEQRNYQHVLNVKWLLRDIRFSILELNANKPLALKTVYELWRINWQELSQALQNAGHKLPLQPISMIPEVQVNQPYVLIIDEINRGNVSRIFGELITLIEPSKRAGAAEALEVVLPYSKKTFKVPGNVYLIGTMNTADRSLTGIDIALRRRFNFKEMLPQPQRLAHIKIEDIDLAAMLEAMNKRIEVLLGRDFCLGHAYFIGLRNGDELVKLAHIFRYKILPLLQEYFFEDWQRIAWVLNDQHKNNDEAFVRQESSDLQSIFGGSDDIAAQALPWRINELAFGNVRSFLGIVVKQA